MTRPMTDAEATRFEVLVLQSRLKRANKVLSKLPIKLLREAGMSWDEINKLS